MTRQIFSILSAFLTLTTFAQNKMRTTDELINNNNSGWVVVNELIAKAKNKVDVLSVDHNKSRDILYKTQVTTKSPMGAIIYETGGIIVDNGWIRILGSGNEKLKRNLPEWNKGKSFKEFGEQAKFLLIADDAIGGFFILNGGELGKDLGKIYYFSPDNLEYEPLDLTYTEFLNFCFNSNLEEFYKDYRWKNWKLEIGSLDGDKVYNFYPYLWTKEGKNINKNARKPVPIEEQYRLNLDFRKQLGLEN